MFRLKVKDVAARQGLSQRQLYLRSGVDIKTVQRIFRAPTSTVVSIETLDRLAMAIGVDISELIESVPRPDGQSELVEGAPDEPDEADEGR